MCRSKNEVQMFFLSVQFDENKRTKPLMNNTRGKSSKVIFSNKQREEEKKLSSLVSTLNPVGKQFTVNEYAAIFFSFCT
jgi:hypothetical protein